MEEKALAVVRDYIIEHLEDPSHVPVFKLWVLWRSGVAGLIWNITSSLLDDMDYMVAYNSDKKEWHLAAYKRIEVDRTVIKEG